MQHIIQFLLIGLISTLITKVESKNVIRKFVERYSRDDGMNIINSTQHVLKVSTYILDEHKNGLVCKGTYDDIPVSIKITSFERSFNDEMNVYEALNGEDAEAESHGIPKVYYHGNVFRVSTYNAIAMSLFEETLEQRYTKNPIPFSDFSVLVIFKQAVKTLEYLNLKRVLHNDIKPENLFLRKTNVFIADFDLSTLNEAQAGGYTYEFASSNRFENRDRCAMDDLESLIFSMWHVAGFDFSEPYGKLLMEQKKIKQAKIWVKTICKRFNFEVTQKVFKDICINEMLSGKKVPEYGRIIKMLSDAIDAITQINKQIAFEWRSEASAGESDVFDRISCFGCSIH